MDERERVSKCLEITVNGVIQRIPLEKVFFFESNARKITVYTAGENIEFYNKLDMLEGILSEKGFLRCHQSYLINEKYIDSMSRETVMVKGEKIPMSRKYYERMKAEGRFF
jgi:DNA-binding LytR/AlgR family response regulator